MYIPILFAPPKQGGILQSSGFLDLTSLIALSQTAKAHAYDELSLILYIENEVTLDHQVRTREDAIRFLELACLRFVGWLRDGWCTRDVAHYATEFGYFVMFSKMLRTATDWGEVYAILYYALRTNNTVLRNVAGAKPESLRLILNALPEARHLQFVSMRDRCGNTVLDYTARYGRPESLQFLLSIYPDSQHFHAACGEGNTVLYSATCSSTSAESALVLLDSIPESQRLQAVSTRDSQGMTVLHHAASSDKSFETIKMILALYPEPERVGAVSRQDTAGMTVLHHSASTGCLESIQLILSIYPESERIAALCKPDEKGRTALHYAADSYNHASVQFLLTQLPESHRLQVVRMQDRDGDTALHLAANSCANLRVILDSLAESECSPVFVICNVKNETALHYVAMLGYSESLPAVLELIPESERLQFMCLQDNEGLTPLHKCIFTNSCDLKIVKALLGWIPAPQRLQVVSVQDRHGGTALHRALRSNHNEVFQEILESLPESERIQAVMLRNGNNEIALHHAAELGNIETIRMILALHPESERLQAVCMQNRNGKTALHCAASSHKLESVRTILRSIPEAQRLQAVSVQDGAKWTVLQYIASIRKYGRQDDPSIQTILELVPGSQQMMDRQDFSF